MTKPICGDTHTIYDVQQNLCLCVSEILICKDLKVIAANVAVKYDTAFTGEACAVPYWCIDKAPEYADVDLCAQAQANGIKYGCNGEKLAKAERFFAYGFYDWDNWPKDDEVDLALCYLPENIPRYGQTCPQALGFLPDAYNAITDTSLAEICVKSGFLGSTTCPNIRIKVGEGVINAGDTAIRGASINDLSGQFIEQSKISSTQVCFEQRPPPPTHTHVHPSPTRSVH